LPETDKLSAKVKTTYQISQMYKTTVDNGEYLIEYDKQKWVKLEDLKMWLIKQRVIAEESYAKYDALVIQNLIDRVDNV
jgi:hypothetical protein